MIVKLSTHEVELKEELTWGEEEELQSIIRGGVQIKDFDQSTKKGDIQIDPSITTAAKYKTFELCIKKIIDAEGNEVKYSKEWIYNLSRVDGNKLMDAVDKVTNPDTETEEEEKKSDSGVEA